MVEKCDVERLLPGQGCKLGHGQGHREVDVAIDLDDVRHEVVSAGARNLVGLNRLVEGESRPGDREEAERLCGRPALPIPSLAHLLPPLTMYTAGYSETTDST